MMLITRLATLKKLSTFEKSIQAFRRYSQKSINLSEPTVQNYFDHLIVENEHLLMKDDKSPTEVRRLRKIKPVVNVLTQRTCLQKSIAALKESKRCEEDEEVKNMMEEEYEIYYKRAKEIENQLQSVLLEPVLTNSEILLVIVATEGDEANLFVKELFEMYTSYGKYKNWRVDVASVEDAETGFKRASILIEGLGALELMNLENGVHHRVSDKNQPNRISTVSVSVLLQPAKTEMNVPREEVTVETKAKSSDDDANSQNYVRVTHTPTGATLMCKANKSNKRNTYVALKELNTLLFYKNKQKAQSEEKGCAGLIPSSRIIRTYDFIRDRVMEHREEDSQHRLKSFLEGGEDLERLHEDLLSRQQHQELLNEIRKFKKKQEEDIEEEVYTPGSM